MTRRICISRLPPQLQKICSKIKLWASCNSQTLERDARKCLINEIGMLRTTLYQEQALQTQRVQMCRETGL